MKNHKHINAKYNQDYVNGFTKKDYKALFDYIKKIQPKTILDLAGGNGTLSLSLKKAGYDVYLSDHSSVLIDEAVTNGFPRDKTFISDIFELSVDKKFDVIIIKSSVHEFPKKLRKKLYQKIYNLLNKDGILINWDAYFQTKEQSSWAIKYINLKDAIAGLDGLVDNRSLATIDETKDELKSAGFNMTKIIYSSFYNFSNAKFSEVYWNANLKKTELFYKKTIELLKVAPYGMKYKSTDKDVKIKFPLIVISAKK